MIYFAKHAHYKLDLIQTHVIFLHVGIKYCQNWSVITTDINAITPLGGIGGLLYVGTHNPENL